MKNERGTPMKRLLCVILVLCLFPAYALCVDFDSFNAYAAVFGATEIDPSKALEAKGLTICTVGAQRVTFSEHEDGSLKRIFIEGDGVDFLAYSMAAIMMFDPSSDNYAVNAGQLLSAFLLSRTQSESAGETVEGNVFLIQAQNKGFVFTIGK